MKLYPLTFDPIFSERLWGGRKLETVLGKKLSGDQIGESWELSAMEGAVSQVSNGPLAGTSLEELVERFGEEILGNRVLERFGRKFPILVKFIDAKLDLSIQVHPGDEQAAKEHNSFGKTEMWYIMQADPGSRLILGFNRDITRQEYQDSLAAGRLMELVHQEPVQEGDTFFIAPGTIHAIGEGIMLAEIQQTSDITYRVYDFDRLGKDGRKRELHTDLALEAMNYQVRDDFRVEYPREPNQSNAMVSCPYFITNYLHLTQNMASWKLQQGSFTIFVCVSGSADLCSNAGDVHLNMGQTALIPACIKSLSIRTEGVKFLEVSL